MRGMCSQEQATPHCQVDHILPASTEGLCLELRIIVSPMFQGFIWVISCWCREVHCIPTGAVIASDKSSHVKRIEIILFSKVLAQELRKLLHFLRFCCVLYSFASSYCSRLNTCVVVLSYNSAINHVSTVVPSESDVNGMLFRQTWLGMGGNKWRVAMSDNVLCNHKGIHNPIEHKLLEWCWSTHNSSGWICLSWVP